MPRAGNYLVFRRVASDTPLAVIFLVVRRVGSFSYTPRAAICLNVKRIRSFSYTHRVRECLIIRRVGNLSYTPRASMSCFPFVRVSVIYRVMESLRPFGSWGEGPT